MADASSAHTPEPPRPPPDRTRPTARSRSGRDHAASAATLDGEADALDRRALRYGLVRLALVVAALGLIGGAVRTTDLLFGAGAAVCAALFAALYVADVRLVSAREERRERARAHARQAARESLAFRDFPVVGEDLVPANHPYAHDLDVVGHGSLVQRADVTGTARGLALLVSWLLAPADLATARLRQAAARELSERADVRIALEAATRRAGGKSKLDAGPFLSLVGRPTALATRPAAAWLLTLVPGVVIACVVAWMAGALPGRIALLAVVAQGLASIALRAPAADAFDRLAAKRGAIEGFTSALRLIEGTQFEAPLLVSLRERVARHGTAVLRKLDTLASLAELRHQGPLHFVVDAVTLWDLQVLLRLERWFAAHGEGLTDVVEALAEFEALSSLAALADADPGATFPELMDDGGHDGPDERAGHAARDAGAPHRDGAHARFEATRLAHPLLAPETRVANDVTLVGPGHALVVTGSNMAGKSTLLRAVGLGVALALAGGPVVAERMRLGRVRLRASMRAVDSLEHGASYFHAELERLRVVIDRADEAPPVFFVLDELLRGTNPEARRLGARAIVVHLLRRGAMGLVATHDEGLVALEDERPGAVVNAHFTDVVEDGVMRFDYRLRPGPVRSSNALRLLSLAGVDLDEADLAPPGSTRG